MFPFALLLVLAIAEGQSNTPGKPLVIIAPPSVNNAYYKDRFDDLIKFHTLFAKSVLGKDNILVLADTATRPYFKDLPSDILLDANLEDIWMRDFGTVIQGKPVKFVYRPGYLKAVDAQSIDNGFINLLKRYGVTFSEGGTSGGLNVPLYKNLVIDGGNVVYNGVDKAVLTSRLYEENPGVNGIKEALQTALGYQNVAIVTQFGEKAEDTTGHIDGLVSFVDRNVLIVSKLDEPKRTKLLGELQSAFGTELKLVELPNSFSLRDVSATGFTSACGLHVNSLVTDNFIYMPTFGEDPVNVGLGYVGANDDSAYQVFSANSPKKVVNISVPYKVCSLGGSIRCLSMQIGGPIADLLISKAK